MTSITFDTLAYSKTLQRAGIAREQADALAQANADAIKNIITANELVTKKDMLIALNDTKHELLKWMVAMLLAQTTLTITAIGIGVAILK